MTLTVREYRYGDFESVCRRGNEFIDRDVLQHEGTDFAREHTFVFDDEGVPYAIIFYYPYHPDHYSGSFMAVDGLTIRHLKYTYDFYKKWLESFNVKRFETHSVSCDKLKKWHEFLGFKHEGVRVAYKDGVDYDMWGLVRDGT